LTESAHGRDLETGESESGRFMGLLASAIEGAAFVRLVLATYRGAEPGLTRVTVRRVAIRGEDHLSFLYHYRTRDVTTNASLAAGLETVRGLLGDFGNAHLLTTTGEIQLALSKKGRYSLRSGKAAHTDLPSTAHDREKTRMVALDRPFLAALSVTNAQHQLVPAMSRKWKQINKFIEVVDQAMASSGLKTAGRLRVADFGAGKGYLTFAVHDYLQNTLGLQAEVTGVELREDLVRFCQAAVRQLGIGGLSFRQGDIASHVDAPLDIMIALHACDTATDHAIHRGIRSGAAIILCSPCCHKEIRPQMTSPPLLRPLLGHGIHLGQEAEMVTDSLRALLLEANGYAAQVFEFVSLEHTSKNKMILGVKRAQSIRPESVLAQIRELKAFYGIRDQCLETLLKVS
jgi:SAM-dependent methyltransferase